MRVDEVGVGRRVSRRMRERREHHRDKSAEPRPPLDVAEHAVSVRDPEVAERLRGNDVDVDVLAQSLDCVRDEATRGVSLPARVRRRQDDDLHARCNAREKTSGSASTSTANA
jgi:hypothetical protein